MTAALERVILVTGGREYRDGEKVAQVLTELAPTLVLTGGAPGTDFFARTWAKKNGIHTMTCDALWDFTRSTTFSRGAGPIRNAVMIAVCKRLGGSVVAFPGGTGTEDTVAKARVAGLEVRVVEGAYPPPKLAR